MLLLRNGAGDPQFRREFSRKIVPKPPTVSIRSLLTDGEAGAGAANIFPVEPLKSPKGFS
jgi:hypothetical protein